MAFRRPSNPAVMTVDKFRVFDGIGGPVRQVLIRLDDKGGDISNSVANQVVDLSLLQAGSMIKRSGYRKIEDTGESATITNLMAISVGKVEAYGVVVDGALKIITLPSANPSLNPVEMVPANQADTASSVYPATDPSIWY